MKSGYLKGTIWKVIDGLNPASDKAEANWLNLPLGPFCSAPVPYMRSILYFQTSAGPAELSSEAQATSKYSPLYAKTPPVDLTTQL